jgi:selenide,water dikinase
MTEPIKLTQYSKGGGCGCKIAPAVLEQIVRTNGTALFPSLLVGNETADDAAVYQINDTEAIISTTDFFLPIVDDAFDFGRVAAANAISDVYAMGGTPLLAIAILGFPVEKLPVETAQQILEGGRSICQEAGIPLAGGHTIDSADPIFGLAVTGKAAVNHLKRNIGAEAGDQLFLTKAIGTGLLSTALKRGVLQEGHYEVLIQQLTTINKLGAQLGQLKGVHAMTDVTGFGLLGHAIEMAEGSGISMSLQYNAIKKMEGVDEYLKQRTIPDATYRNWNSYNSKVQFEKGVNVMEAFTVLPDPQTNGGLLIAVAADAVEEVQALLRAQGLDTFLQPIGRCIERGEKVIVVEQ